MTGVVITRLLVNGLCAFTGALVVVLAAGWLFRVRAPRWRLALLALPLLRVAWEWGRGGPTHSYVWHAQQGHLWDRGDLVISAGLTWPLSPVLRLQSQAHLASGRWSLTAGDVVALVLERTTPGLATILVAIVAAIGVTLVGGRLVSAWRFDRQRRLAAREAQVLEQRRIGWRWVQVYLDESGAGEPFTGGWLQPYVCFPAAAHARLDDEGRRAVLEHELAHVRGYHVPLLMGLGLVADLLWFVPGCRWLVRKIEGELELVADDASLARGADALRLADAMVTLAEQRVASGSATAHLRSPSQVARRVRRLVACPHPATATGLWYWLPRLIGLLAIARSAFAISLGSH